MIDWLRQRLSRKHKPRRARRGYFPAGPRRPVVESLEARRLLTVTASESGGVLSVQMDGSGDTAVISEDIYQDVTVLNQDGTIVFEGPAASGITAIDVTSSGINDTTDLTQVGASTDFTNLATIDVGAGIGAQVLLSGSYDTTGNQTYSAAVTLRGNVSLYSSGDIDFGGTIDGGFTLTSNATTAVTFGGAVGGASELTGLYVYGGALDLNGGSVHTTNAQVYNDAVTLTANTTLTSDTEDVQFESTIDGAYSLTTSAGTRTMFFATVGGATPLASLTTSGAGQTEIGAAVNTTGFQSYQQDVLLAGVNQGDVFSLSTQGGDVTFSGTVDSYENPDPQFTLIVNTNGAGTTTFGGAVGATMALDDLTVTSGAIDLNGGSVQTLGAQAYNAPVALSANTTLTSTGGGDITFSQTLDSGVDGPYSLTVNTAGTTTFGGRVGGIAALDTLTTDSPGTTAINGGGVTTSDAQYYFDAVTLGSAGTLLTSTDGGTILFAASLDGASALAVSTTGVTVFFGSVGAATPLNSLSISSGDAELSGPVSTTGNQSYQGDVSLDQDVTLTTHGGNVAFGGQIDSSGGEVTTTAALVIDTTAGGAAPAGGLVMFAGDIGSLAPLSTLTVIAAGPLTLAHHVTTVGNQLFTVVPSSSATNGLTLAAGGLLSSQGAVELRSGDNLTIAAGGGITANGITLRGDFNNSNPAAATAVLLAGNLQSPTVAVFTGNGNTTVNVVRALANTATTITGGAGTDSYNLSSAAPSANGVLSTLAGAITINGGAGVNTLMLGDAADLPGLPGTLTPSIITGFGMANGIQYANLQNIIFRLSAGPAEALSIVGTAPGSAVAVNGGHTIVLGGVAGGLDQIAGSLAINQATVLDINDQLSTTAHTYDFSAGYFLRSGLDTTGTGAVPSAALPGQVGVSLANVQNTVINGGTGKNVYNLFLPLAPGQAVAIQGGGGGDYVHVVGSNAGPNTAYVGNPGSGDPIQIGGVNCLTMYGAANQSNTFVNQTAVNSILIGGLANDTLLGGSGADVSFGGGGNDFLVAGGSSGGNYVFANMLPAYLPNGMLNPNVGNGAIYPGLPGSSMIDGGGGVVVYFNRGTQVFNASQVIMMDCDLPGSRAMLQNVFNQALAGNECLAMLTSPPAPPDPPISQAMSINYGPYVQRAYQDILGRAADQAGLSFWAAQLAGGLSRATFANALTHSDEYYQRLIATDYLAYLGRAVDNAALGFWTNQFEHGASDQQLESVLLGSNEFYQRSGGGDAGWINSVYQALLGRSADSQGEAYWSGQLQAGASRQAIAYQIAVSPEAFARVVNADYQQALGRTPGAAEVQYWVGQLVGGASNENVLAGFVASDEFASLS